LALRSFVRAICAWFRAGRETGGEDEEGEEEDAAEGAVEEEEEVDEAWGVVSRSAVDVAGVWEAVTVVEDVEMGEEEGVGATPFPLLTCSSCALSSAKCGEEVRDTRSPLLLDCPVIDSSSRGGAELDSAFSRLREKGEEVEAEAEGETKEEARDDGSGGEEADEGEVEGCDSVGTGVGRDERGDEADCGTDEVVVVVVVPMFLCRASASVTTGILHPTQYTEPSRLRTRAV
jgi:hypothetical protein